MNRLWSIGVSSVAALVGAPLLVVLAALVAPSSASWPHLKATVLTDYVVNTVLLMLAVGALAAGVGIATAWTIATRDFPLRRLLSWALVLPLAVPAYMVAYVYTDLLESGGAKLDLHLLPRDGTEILRLCDPALGKYADDLALFPETGSCSPVFLRT